MNRKAKRKRPLRTRIDRRTLLCGDALERRRVLTGGGDSTATPLPAHELAMAEQAALLDFYGPDGKTKDGPMVKTGFDLDLLYEESKLHDQLHPGTALVPSNDLLVTSAGSVLVDVVASGNLAAFQSQVSALGMNVTATAGSLVEGMLPIGAISQLAAISSLSLARPSYLPQTDAGSVESQGDAALQADVARSTYKVDGTGVTIGVLSDSFDQIPYADGTDGMKRDIQTGDLPRQTTVLQDSLVGEDEGRGMAQLIHDVAPGAAIKFATAEGGEANFAKNIRALAAAGSNVIVDDVGYFTEPFFQDGLVAQAVNSVVAGGAAYFSAAGNEGIASYESAFVNSGVTGPGGGKLHDFDPSPAVDTAQQITLPVGAAFNASFQWDQPFRSLGGSGSASDLDIYLLGADRKTVLASSVVNNLNGDPLELLQFGNDGTVNLDGDQAPDTTFYVEIELVAGPAPGLMKYVDNGREATIDTFATDSSTDVGHSNAASAMGVAAAAFFFTPAFGQTPPVLNIFSSKGGTQTLFDPSGNRLAAPVLHGSPQVTGVDGANTTFFGDDVPQDSDTLPNFFGTSAAAPHVAAVAALMIQAAGGSGVLAPSDIYTALEDSGIDIVSREDQFNPGESVDIPDGTGTDLYSGHGLVDATKAVQIVQTQVSLGPDVSMLEGDSGTTPFVFSVTLTGQLTSAATVTYSTFDGTAVAFEDYQPTAGTLTFSPGGATVQFITVSVLGDLKVEPDESFTVRLTNITRAHSNRLQATGMILNDDVDIAINDVSIVEGNTGTRNAVFTITSDGATSQNISLNWVTQDITAQGGSDYVPEGGTVFLPAGGGSINVTVPVIGDTLDEQNETFEVSLFNPSLGHLIKANGIGTILDDDLTSFLFVSDVPVRVLTTVSPSLDPAPTPEAVFTVALDRPSGQDITVGYTTSDGSAIAGQDYTPTSGTLFFPAGSTLQTVVVPVTSRLSYAPNEQFSLILFNPVNALISDATGTATLIAAPAPVEQIIDDGEDGFSATPGWNNVSSTQEYHLDFDYHAPGSSGDMATWNFAGLTAGSYQVFVHWVPFSNQATNAPFSVVDAAGTHNVAVNQQVAPAGDASDGLTWQSLGTFQPSGGSLTVRLAANANGYVIADAARVVPNGVTSHAGEMDVSGFGRSVIDSALAPASALFADGTDFGSVASATGSVRHTFTITNTGNADLHLTGAPRVALSGADAADFTVLTLPPSTIPIGGTASFDVMFHPQGIVAAGELESRHAVLTIMNDDPDKQDFTIEVGGTAVATGPSTLVVDDLDGGFHETGFDADAISSTYHGQMSSAPAGNGSAQATWSFHSLAPGNYTIYATWSPYGNQATNAPFAITDGTNGRATVLENEQLAPADLSSGGVMWKAISTLDLANGDLTVMLSNRANGFVVGDAIMLVRNDMPVAPSTTSTTTGNPSNPTAAPFAHNAARPLDVNGDGHVSAVDALILMDYFLMGQTGAAPTATPHATPASSSTVTSASSYFIDVSGDGHATAVDLLLVLDYLLVGTLTTPVAAPSASPAAVASSALLPSAASTNAASTNAVPVVTSAAMAAAAVDQALAGAASQASSPPSAGRSVATPVVSVAASAAASPVPLAAVQACFADDEQATLAVDNSEE